MTSKSNIWLDFCFNHSNSLCLSLMGSYNHNCNHSYIWTNIYISHCFLLSSLLSTSFPLPISTEYNFLYVQLLSPVDSLETRDYTYIMFVITLKYIMYTPNHKFSIFIYSEVFCITKTIPLVICFILVI